MSDAPEGRPGDELDRIRQEVLARLPPPFERPPVDPAAAGVPVPSPPRPHAYAGSPPPDDQPAELPQRFLDEPPLELPPWQHVWLKDKPVAITSHRAGIGPFIVTAKKLLRRFLRAPLADLFDRQRVFNAVVIHNFDRVGRLEETVLGLVERTVPAVIARNDALYAVQDAALESQVAELRARMQRLEDGAVARFDAQAFWSFVAESVRGPVVALVDGPFVEACRARGVEAHVFGTRCGDVLAAVTALPESSAGALYLGPLASAATAPELLAQARAAVARLVPGGVVACELPEPLHPRAVEALWLACGVSQVRLAAFGAGRHGVAGMRA